MPSSYTTSLRLTLPATGELSGTWGSTVNTGITELLDAAVAGTASISTWGGAGVAYTLSNNSGTADEARRMFIVATGTPGEAKNVICPAVSKMYVFRNDTTGGFALTLKTSGGTGISVPAGQYKFLYCDGTNVVETFNSAGALTLSGALSVGGTATFAANPTLSAGTANQVQYLNASKVLVGSANLTFDGTALTLGGNPTLSAGTANGVTYLNGSKMLTSGSALTFNGTSLGVASVASTAALSLSSATSTAINLNIGGTELARLSANVNGIFTVGTEGSVAGLGTGYATLGAYSTNGGGFRIYRGTGAGTSSAFFYADSTGTFLGSAENTSLLFYQNNTERARITSGGNLLVGTTTDPGSTNSRLAVDHTGSDYGLTLNTATSAGPNLLQFRNSNSNGEARLLNNTGGPLTFYRNPTTEAARITSVGDFIPIVQTAAPTLTSNQQMVFTLTSNTNLRISVRGTDGTTRVANITLA